MSLDDDMSSLHVHTRLHNLTESALTLLWYFAICGSIFIVEVIDSNGKFKYYFYTTLKMIKSLKIVLVRIAAIDLYTRMALLYFGLI